ncbi:hypothetical protein [Streptomyces sp. NPDC048111]|uniref:hypothetical protein n=1 Tax=Streptomyces sp. NPDC048111 TaxID=3365500 RepID=UPI003718050F
MQPSPSPSPAAGRKVGSVVGLLWINGEEVCLGTPPGPRQAGVFLTPAGVRISGDAPREWLWSDLLDLRVSDAPVRSAVTRWATHALSVAAAAVDAWIPGGPAEMTVTLTTKDGESTETPVFSGAAVAHSQREVDLSLGLLARFVRGELSPGVLTRWWREVRPAEVLRAREREAALEGWLGIG